MEKTDAEFTSGWFWKVFGGAIFGAITLLLLALNNNQNNNFNTLRDSIKDADNKIIILREDNNKLAQRILSVELLLQNNEIIANERKTRIDEAIQSLKEQIKELQVKPKEPEPQSSI